jgi:arsenical pump membrane protein
VIGFLAAVLVLAWLCNEEGLFRACGAWMARTATGRPRRLLVYVFAVASVITAMLSLDRAWWQVRKHEPVPPLTIKAAIQL